MKYFVKGFAAMLAASALTLSSAILVGNRWGADVGQFALFVFMPFFFVIAIRYCYDLRNQQDGITPELRAKIERLIK